MLAPPEPTSKRKPARLAQRTVSIAATALEALAAQFGDDAFAADFDRLTELVFACRGRIIVTGLGKSGIVAQKLTVTFIATGTKADYLHPGDAGLGDIGMVEPEDVVLVVSRSGGASELAPIISYCKRFGVTLVMVTSSARGAACRFADLCIRLPRVREACLVHLTPTTSTTVQLVFGDALAMAVMARRGFSQEDFHKFHPSGRLGARLLKVGDIMASGDSIPRVGTDATLADATVEMTRARFGGTAIMDGHGRLIGVFTDGDLRRAITDGARMTERVGDRMTRCPSTISPREFASEALARMQGLSITMLFVVEGPKLIGVVHVSDMLDAGTA